MIRKAVILLSGGLDAATVLAIAKAQGLDCYALSFRYGQRHAAELDAAGRVAKHLGVTQHVVLDIDLRQFGGSALTSDIPVPKDRHVVVGAQHAAPLHPDNGGALDPAPLHSDIPLTYVPARNTIFLSFALAWAEVLGAQDIFIGVNALDYSGYPHFPPPNPPAFERMAGLAPQTRDEG